jgi:hypothetical protein
MATCLIGLAGITLAPSFAGRILDIHGTRFTSESVIRKIVGMDGTPNLFRLETDRAALELVRLPAVKSASVQVRLPSTVIVDIVERVPKLVWVIGDSHFVVDDDGLLFGRVDSAGNPIASAAGPLATSTPDAGASETPGDTASGDAGSPAVGETSTASPTPPSTPSPKPTKVPTKNPKATPTKPGAKSSPVLSGPPTPTPNLSIVPSLEPAPTVDSEAVSGPQALALAVVYDRRASDANLSLGGVIDPVNLDAGYRLAGLTPLDVGSTASALAVVLDDDHGFTVGSVPTGWVAQFGFYASNVRKVTVIPTQVRDLRSTLAYAGEAKVAWVFLVSDISSDHVITYIPR